MLTRTRFIVSCCLYLWQLICVASGNVLLIGNKTNLSFDDIQANFAPGVKAAGECGVLFKAKPIDACSALVNKGDAANGSCSGSFVLIVRGGCSFEDKVRTAQAAGFKAAIVYDNDDGGVLVAMAGNSAGIKIHAVFVSKASGEILLKYAGLEGMELWIIPSFENSAWSIMAISFISLLAMSAVLATCFFIRRHRIRRDRRRGSRVMEFNGMSSTLVKAIPSLIFTRVLEDNCTSETCAICLEDYVTGEKLRILPCSHKFHAFCVDSWLTTWRTFCPVCKRDARMAMVNPPASESTPLLFFNPSSVASSSAISSVRSSLASSSSVIQIASPSRSYHHHSPSPGLSRSSVDLRNASSQRSQASYMFSRSPHSLGFPSFSPLNSRYRSPYLPPSPSYGSYSYMSSSSQQQPNPLHYSESTASFSPFASAQSLPEC